MMITKAGGAALGKKHFLVSIAVRRALGRTGVAVLAWTTCLFAGTAAAQDQNEPGLDDVMSEVTITGSRIVRDGFEAPTPVAVLGSEELNKMAVTNIADAVNRMPAFAGSVNPRNSSSNVSSGTGGVNHLSLRGLGATRTLVLLDGKRVVGSTLAGFDNNGSAVDINAFPNGLVERVEVVTGGASAVYGSDALAGVVNFILDKDFTGVKGSIDGSQTTYGDNDAYKLALTAGTPFAGERGHLLFSGEHAYEEGIVHTPRPWARTSYQIINNPNYTPTNGEPQLLAVFDAGLARATRGGLIVSCPTTPDGPSTEACPLRGTQFLEGGTPAQFRFGEINGGTLMSGGDWALSRIDTDTTLAIEVERTNAFGRTSYELTDNTTAFAEVLWSHTQAYNHSAVPNFNLGNVRVLSGNPFIPPSIQAQMTALDIPYFMLGTVNGDMPFLQADNERTLRRYVAGLEGRFDLFGRAWRWDTYFAKSTQDITAKSPGNRINANYARAIDAVFDESGRIVCRVNVDADPTNDDPACVPYNPMGIGVNSPEAIAYVTGTGHSWTRMKQDVAAATVSGEPFSTWAGPASLAFGVEYRKESVGGWASELDERDGFFAGNYHATHGRYNVKEGFLETVVPVVSDQRFAQSLELNGAVRWTDYSTSGEVITWKLGATWQPVDSMRFRTTLSRDIRAPNLGDLFLAGRSGTGNIVDPFTNTTSTVVSRIVGNPNLKPEEADTTGIGLVLTLPFLPGFAASIDYYDIEIKNAIATLEDQDYVDRCFAGETQLCSAIIRDADGFIQTVYVQPANVLAQRARGFDIELSYTFPLSNLVASWTGDLSLRGMATYVDSLKTIDAGMVVEGAGVNADDMGTGAGNAMSSPRLRYLLSATYNRDPFSVSMTMRGIGSGKYNNAFIECSSACPPATPEHPTINNNHIDDVVYFDLAVEYRTFGGKAQAYLVAENVLDEDPPLIAGSRGNGFYAGQGNQDLYDRLGRIYRVGVRFNF